ncbi:MAG TPA: PRC-barrel domain-containing protein [Gammaproteobacteria bacterium]
MKRAPLLLIAMLPFMASAGGDKQAAQVDQEKLKNAVPVTEIVGQDVRSSGGEEFGEVDSVAFTKNGEVAYYAIEPDMEMYESTSASYTPGEDEVLYGSNEISDGADHFDDDSAMIGRVGTSIDLIYVEPDKVSFDESGNIVTVKMTEVEFMEGQGTVDRTDQEGLIEATDVVGMEVDLADAESFGEVEDVMIGEDATQAVALVVDSWDGANKERRALPVALDSVNAEDESIRYEFGKDALAETGSFELEQYNDQ